ncbi:putative serine/threonine protein kinase [Actinacidiphila reveromycinica]|uniref:Putative serine/threonine protein kinase n=1 Tax=Actinacidiphila reveromycinica TaxID=659352 RepID=A0A7U3VLD5_9ACTN|nr:hypothetical protein [Streptomyces sp. SN-593]BBA95450.1 putative serine/threonine protein kinase [Streptomyces sp. SN-593]
MTVIRCSPEDLGPYEEHRLGTGGQGHVYAVSGAPGGLTGEYVYKAYRRDIDVDAAVLEEMTGFLSGLPAAERSFLDERLAWPAALVEDGGRVTGFLMRRVPGRFLLDPGDPHAPTAAMQFLLNGSAHLRNMAAVGHRGALRFDTGPADRLGLLADVARTIDTLHRNGAVVGDLSPKNLLVALSPDPRVLLIDCDSMRLRGRSAVPPVETGSWAVPCGEDPATEDSDAYKYGLLAVRLFNRDQSSTDPGPLRAVSPELAALAQRALDEGEPHSRPRVREWLGPLEEALDAQAPAPTPTPVPAPTPARRSRRLLAAAMAVVQVVGVVWWLKSEIMPGSSADARTQAPGFTASAPYAGQPTSEGGAPVNASPDAPPSTSPSTPPFDVPVYVDPAVQGVAGSAAVAEMFGAYFGGINTDLELAAAQIDRDGKMFKEKGGKAKWMQEFEDSGTWDSDVRLHALVRHATGDVTASVTFQSEQRSGHGPTSASEQTCTLWKVTYRLSAYGDGTYKIYDAKAPGPPACPAGTPLDSPNSS